MRRTPLTTTLCHPAAEKPSYATRQRAIYECCVRQTSSARLCRSQSTVTCRASPAATPPLMLLLLLLLLATVLTITRRTAADCAATTDTRRSAHLPMTSSVTCAARAPTTRGRRRSRTATDSTSVSVSYRRIHDVSSLCLSRANQPSETDITRVFLSRDFGRVAQNRIHLYRETDLRDCEKLSRQAMSHWRFCSCDTTRAIKSQV